MDVANELLDAIEIIVDKKIRENTAQIYPGICKSVSGSSCVMSINGKDNTIQFYGSIPTVGAIYRVFVPDSNMSMAFAITGNDDRKGLYYSNPNLLDNWYFGNPVNQRGMTEYDCREASGMYTIDRWKFIDSGKLTVCDGYISIEEANWGIDQLFETPKAEDVFYTASMLIRNFKLVAGPGNGGMTLNGDWLTREELAEIAGSEWTLISRTVLGSNGKSNTSPIFTDGNDGRKYSFDLKAAKLELGTQQTLAHQDADGVWQLNEIPDYGEQLARCQRYFQLYSTADNRPSKAVDCRPTMRTDPSQGTIIIDGTTYYYNTADLQGVYMGLLKEL